MRTACEKCWHDAHNGPGTDVAEAYLRLIRERASSPCTPEEQAGPDAPLCEYCDRRTVHPYVRKCVICGT